MTDFAALDPDSRCLALVGKFLQRWAIMEHAMRDAIEKAFGLDTLQTATLCSNIALRDKTNILKTVISLAVMPDNEKTQYAKIMEAIATASTKRNMMAHDLFYASGGSNGVTFYVTKAKGKLEFPDTTWTIEKFQEEYSAIDGHAESLRRLTERLSYSELMKQMFSPPKPGAITPSAGLFGLTHSSPPNPLAQGLLGYLQSPSIPETDTQTPAEPQKE